MKTAKHYADTYFEVRANYHKGYDHGRDELVEAAKDVMQELINQIEEARRNGVGLRLTSLQMKLHEQLAIYNDNRKK